MSLSNCFFAFFFFFICMNIIFSSQVSLLICFIHHTIGVCYAGLRTGHKLFYCTYLNQCQCKQCKQEYTQTHTHSLSLSFSLSLKNEIWLYTHGCGAFFSYWFNRVFFFLYSISSCILQMLSFTFSVLLTKLRQHKGLLIREYIKAYILAYILSIALFILFFLKRNEVNMINID